jgi:hypothetical protein
VVVDSELPHPIPLSLTAHLPRPCTSAPPQEGDPEHPAYQDPQSTVHTVHTVRGSDEGACDGQGERPQTGACDAPYPPAPAHV